MATKDGRAAKCPRFICRVDFQGMSAIQCAGWNLVYFDRKERDADYVAACCENPERCPIKQAAPITPIIRACRSNDMAPNLRLRTPNYPTFDTITQEAQNHERK